MKTPHKHAELIKAWADGAKVQVKNARGVWTDCNDPYWSDLSTYRIKPELEPDFVYYGAFRPALGAYSIGSCFSTQRDVGDQIKLIFDVETGKLKAAEVLQCSK